MWCYLLYYKDANGNVVNRLFNEEDDEFDEEHSGIPQAVLNVIPEPESMEPHIMHGIYENNDYMYPNFNFSIKEAIKNIKLNNVYKGTTPREYIYRNTTNEGIINFELNFGKENPAGWVETFVWGQYRHDGLYTLDFEWNTYLQNSSDLLDSLNNNIEKVIPEEILDTTTWNDFADFCVYSRDY